jgi:hypothetical protein
MSRTQTSPPVPPSALAAAALADPAVHRQCEQDFIQHVQALLADDRLRIDTTRGRRPVPAVPKVVVQAGPTATCSTACPSGRRWT